MFGFKIFVMWPWLARDGYSEGATEVFSSIVFTVRLTC